MDRLLQSALRLGGPWRPLLARRAAMRGLHVAALRAEPDDPDILVELGMYLTAERVSGDTAARAAALAGLGRIAESKRFLAALPPLGPYDRMRLARIAAVSDPAWALDLAPVDHRLERAACLLALSRADEAEALTGGTSETTEARLLLAAISTARRDWRQARMRLNTLYGMEGLAAVLDETDSPLSLSAFRSLGLPSHEGGPLVSVVIAARDAAATLDTALASLQAQTWRSLEILVVDDGSTDDTQAKVAVRAAADDRIRLLTNVRAPGAYGARNTGLTAARGAIIAFHDADDWAHPQRIVRQVEAISHGRDAAVCGHFRLDADGLIMSPRVFPLARLNPILTVVRRDVIDRLGPFEETRLGADSEFLARLQAGLGRSAVARDRVPMVVAGWSRSSLMSAPDTGLSQEGLALRVAYVEAWRRRHAFERLKP